MLHDERYEVSPGKFVRSFSVEHLSMNRYNEWTPAMLAAGLAKLSAGTPSSSDPAWRFAALADVSARRLVQCFSLSRDSEALTDKSAFSAPSDRELVESLVSAGHGLGLGAAWGTSPEAELFWAAAATLTRYHGCSHPNDIPDQQSG